MNFRSLQNSRNGDLFRRFVSLFMVAIIFGMMLFFAAPGVSAASASQHLGEVELIHWRWAKNRNFMPDNPDWTYYLWLVWDTGCLPIDYEVKPNDHQIKVCDYYGGTKTAEYFIPGSDDFYTSNSWNMPTIRYVKEDKDNCNAPTYRIHFGNYAMCHRSESDAMGFSDGGDGDAYGFQFYGEKKYGASCDVENSCCIYYNKSNSKDSGLMRSGNKLYCMRDDDYDDFDWFYVYVGTAEPFSAFTTDYTVMPGDVCNVDNGVFIKEGVTVTIAPGAVLSVEGQMFNNGMIDNYGTIVLQTDSCLVPFQPKNSSGGAIRCFGGAPYNYYFTLPSGQKVPGEAALIVMPGAKLGFEKGCGNLYCYGATIENYGYIATADNFTFYGGTLLNSGIFQVGYAIEHTDALRTTKISTAYEPFTKTYWVKLAGGANTASPLTKSYFYFSGNYQIENTGVICTRGKNIIKEQSGSITGSGVRGKGIFC